MGRPIKGTAKADRRFSMRVTPGFLRVLDRLRKDKTRADYVRDLVRKANDEAAD